MGTSCLAIALLAGACGHATATAPAAPTAAGATSPLPVAGAILPLRHPLVLVHGFSGFVSLGPLRYFHGIPEALRLDGHDVWVARVDPFNSSEQRGAELLASVQQVLTQTGAERVILLGHSQGGLDARWVAARARERIAAVVTIATPHRGSPVADVTLAELPTALQAVAAVALDAFGVLLTGATGHQTLGALATLSGAGTSDFNARTPDQPGVAYFSVAGRSARAPYQAACATADEPELVSRWRSFVDPLNPAFAIPGRVLERALGAGAAHDGLVPVTSARWGTFLGCIPADHLDQICQLGGQSPGEGNPFDCLAFYRELAAWLAGQGF